MSLTSFIGPKPNLLGIVNKNEELSARLEVKQPVLDEVDISRLRDIKKLSGGRFRSALVLDITFAVSEGPFQLRHRNGALVRSGRAGGDRWLQRHHFV